MAMKLTFDAKNDFDSTYYLPGYGCEVHIEVKNGIISLNIEDDGWVKEEFGYTDKVDDSYDILDDDCIDEGMNDLEEEWDEENAEEVEEERLDNDLYKGENVVGDFSSCDLASCPEYQAYGFTCEKCDKTNDTAVTVEIEISKSDIEKSKELINKLAEVDTDGTVMKLLIDLINSGKVSDVDSKASKTFEKILNNIGSLLK